MNRFFLFFYFLFYEVGPNWDPRTQARWPIALYLSFKFIGGYLGVQPSYRGPQSRSASLLLFVLDPSWQSPGSASSPFQMSPAPLFWFRIRKWAQSFVLRLYTIVCLFFRLYTSYFSISPVGGGGDMLHFFDFGFENGVNRLYFVCT